MDLRRRFANLPKESDVREPDGRGGHGREPGASLTTGAAAPVDLSPDKAWPCLFASGQAVQRNKGAAGIDRMTTKELESHLQAHWEKIRAKLLDGTYVPSP